MSTALLAPCATERAFTARPVRRTEITPTGVQVWFTDGTTSWFSHDQIRSLRSVTDIPRRAS